MALSPEILAELKATLLEEKSRLETELGRFAKATDTEGNFETKFDDIGDSPDENATEVEEYVDNLGVENTLETQLKDVTEALARMEVGTYGVDEVSGKDISVERLRAYPGARTAI